jgi:hypothetical protein
MLFRTALVPAVLAISLLPAAGYCQPTDQNASDQMGPISLSVGTSFGQVRGAEIKYGYATNNNGFIKSANNLDEITESGEIAYTFSPDSAISGGVFGSRPKIIVYGSRAFSSAKDTFYSIGEANGNFAMSIDGTYTSTNAQQLTYATTTVKNENRTVGIMLAGSLDDGWSLAPSLGLERRDVSQRYTMDVLFLNGVIAPIFDVNLKSVLAGGQLGLAGATPRWNGFRLTGALNFSAHHVKSSFVADQDPQRRLGTFTDVTVTDHSSHVALGSQMRLGVEYAFAPVTIQTFGTANYSKGMPQIDMPTHFGDRARIDDHQDLWGWSVGLKASYNF